MFHVKHLCIIKILQLTQYIKFNKKIIVKKSNLVYKYIPAKQNYIKIFHAYFALKRTKIIQLNLLN